MAIPLIGGFSSGQLARQLGETYQPKQQRLMVGRDVAAMTHSPLATQGTRDVVVGSAEDTRFSSTAIFNIAAQAAKSGFMVRDFRQIGNQAGIEGNILAATQSVDGQPTLPSVSNGDYKATIDGETLTISEKSLDENDKEKWQAIKSVEVKGDTRLTWDDHGKPSILTGSAALPPGKLPADGPNEMPIRRPSAHVEAGYVT